VIYYGPLDLDLKVQKEKGGEISPARVPVGFPVRSGQREFDGELMVVFGVDAAMNELRLGKEISCEWSSGSFASRSGSEGRLESPWLWKALAVVGDVDSLWFWIEEDHDEVC
jgi:hypothetical protein